MLDGFEMNSGLLTLRFKSLLGKTFVTHFPGRMKELTRRGFADAVREIGLCRGLCANCAAIGGDWKVLDRIVTWV